MFVFELFPVLLSILLAPTVSTVSVEFKAEYFSNITLVCDDRLLNLPYTTFKKYWILPNGTYLQWSYEPGNSSRFLVGESPGFNLTISNIDEDDFGWYYCVILWDNYIYLVHTIKVGLNVNGALYEELFDQYKKSAITGLIAGGSTAMLLGVCCLLYWCRYSETNTKNDEKRGKTESGKTNIEGSDSNTDTILANEKEAIYELDKAVKGFDDDATVVGDGEVAMPLRKEDNIETNNIAGNGSPPNVSVDTVLSQGDIALQELTVSRLNENEDNDGFFDGVPPPPPLPPSLIYEAVEESEHDDKGFVNNGFDLENGNENAGSTQSYNAETERKYLYQEEIMNIPCDKNQYADIKF